MRQRQFAVRLRQIEIGEVQSGEAPVAADDRRDHGRAAVDDLGLVVAGQKIRHRLDAA